METDSKMRQDRNNRRGGGRNNNRGGGHRGGGGGGHRGGGRRHNMRSRRNPTQAAESGNLRERIAVESGHLVLIDQFMLANQQFISSVQAAIDSDPKEKDKIVEKFGGSVVEVDPGTYRIERDPFKFSIVIHKEDSELNEDTLSKDSAKSKGTVYVDTRCLAMIDRELLDDSDLLIKYQQLWFSGQDKACRDLLRDNGGAVRYGFNRHGDELGVYTKEDDSVVCLWPEVAEAAA